MLSVHEFKFLNLVRVFGAIDANDGTQEMSRRISLDVVKEVLPVRFFSDVFPLVLGHNKPDLGLGVEDAGNGIILY